MTPAESYPAPAASRDSSSAPENAGNERRQFLQRALWGAAAAYCFAPAYALWRYVFSPAERPTPPAPPMTLPPDLFARDNYAYLRFGAKNVCLLQQTGAAPPRAFNLRCTHAGCTIAWQAQARKFVCPCHGAEFHADGSPAKLPAVEPLEELAVRPSAEGQTLFDEPLLRR
jgi:nitrite reductase/ring-hydroxylating ferredoxin subunit